MTAHAWICPDCGRDDLPSPSHVCEDGNSRAAISSSLRRFLPYNNNGPGGAGHTIPEPDQRMQTKGECDG